METQNLNRKELADDLAYLEILLEEILEMVERGTLPLKAADALKAIELRQKLLKSGRASKQDIGRLFMQMLNREKIDRRKEAKCPKPKL